MISVSSPITFPFLSVLNSVFHAEALLACLVILGCLPLFKTEELISLLEALGSCEGLANFEHRCGIICVCHLLGDLLKSASTDGESREWSESPENTLSACASWELQGETRLRGVSIPNATFFHLMEDTSWSRNLLSGDQTSGCAHWDRGCSPAGWSWGEDLGSGNTIGSYKSFSSFFLFYHTFSLSPSLAPDVTSGICS